MKRTMTDEDVKLAGKCHLEEAVRALGFDGVLETLAFLARMRAQELNDRGAWGDRIDCLTAHQWKRVARELENEHAYVRATAPGEG